MKFSQHKICGYVGKLQEPPSVEANPRKTDCQDMFPARGRRRLSGIRIWTLDWPDSFYKGIAKTMRFLKNVVFSFFWAPQGPGVGPKCAPGGRLSNPEVSSESGQWRPDWWQKRVLKKSQEPTIVGANYSNLGIGAKNSSGASNATRVGASATTKLRSAT